MSALQVISADEHVVESREFWDDWLPRSLPAKDRDRAPRLVGVGIALDSSAHVLRTFTLFPKLMQRSDDAPGSMDARERVAVLDSERIDVAFQFPQRAMSMAGIADRDLMFACLNSFNEWLADWCKASNGRLQGVPILPTFYRPGATREYIEHLRSLGFRTMMLPNYPRDVRYADPELEPMWDAIEASGMPLNFHISEAPDDNGPGGLGTFLTHSMQPFRKLWAYLVFTGILDRHPAMKVVFTEGGISWIPSALDDADRIHKRFAEHLEPKLPHPPSHYWQRQCYATFMDDPCGIEQIDRIGIDHVLWSSDYPHPEGTIGETERVWQSLRDTLGDAATEAVVSTNAARVYGLDGG
jgi:predicted TIM-barrel fold metal-dependent hydrolase